MKIAQKLSKTVIKEKFNHKKNIAERVIRVKNNKLKYFFLTIFLLFSPNDFSAVLYEEIEM